MTDLDAKIHGSLLRAIPDDRADTCVGRCGLTWAQLQRARLADYLAGRRGTLSEPRDFEREFVADDEGRVRVETIRNTVTGAWVTLEAPLKVHVDDLDRVIAEHQERFLAQCNAQMAQGKASGAAGHMGPWWTGGAM